MEPLVLVGVLKNKRDLDLLLNEHWYRIPMAHMPRRRFDYVAFYQPAIFGSEGKRISWYARVRKRTVIPRALLLPNESNHPNAHADYVRIDIGKPKRLSKSIKNTSPRRISFGFTTLPQLFKAKNILELYAVAETEIMIAHELKRADIPAISQHYIRVNKSRRYRLDFAILCNRGKIAIECDNRKAHSGLRQIAKDRAKDAFLESHGWTVLRLTEEDIMLDMKQSIRIIQSTIRSLGA